MTSWLSRVRRWFRPQKWPQYFRTTTPAERQRDPRFDWKPTGRWRCITTPSSKLVELEEARLVMDSSSVLQQTRWRYREPSEGANPTEAECPTSS